LPGFPVIRRNAVGFGRLPVTTSHQPFGVRWLIALNALQLEWMIQRSGAMCAVGSSKRTEPEGKRMQAQVHELVIHLFQTLATIAGLGMGATALVTYLMAREN
jgi:hypothetical protein